MKTAMAALTATWLTTGAALAQTPGHGIRELTDSGSFEVPAGITSITVELWGAGGGGGGGGEARLGLGPGGAGGGGGSGGYVRTVVTVSPGQSYTVVLGREGRGGRFEGVREAEPGEDGGDSEIRLGTRLVVLAAGGKGGRAASRLSTRGAGGGAGGTVPSQPSSILTRVGNSGASGESGGSPDLNLSTAGGVGGQAVPGTIAPLGSFGGAGGDSLFESGKGNGGNGGRGVAIITW